METISDGAMTHSRLKILGLTATCLVLLSGCGGFKNATLDEEAMRVKGGRERQVAAGDGSILDAFRGAKDTVKVNRFLWTASLQVLDFLPIEAADPFTGVISTGYGTPPGGGQSYRATILISDPALDARSLNVALQTRGGAVNAATERAVEDAILNRARQLRINAARF
ncbi:MAG: hypothetical protein VR71_14005 [Roseovarius sp. BRH_c41]|jgi:hypothetical protein|uniref:DUF3576 domain-containing protein n=1 Tax=Roseovarius sp. BRH_c41 TaxID=1629709 RepID=UPI0005F1CE7E|nr:DUF3576 domain-containing protein [Roseovarius sp. BRH_c41]KJS42615.1 MAG: hypothetical protein VR71_14005 [Roseovarius sp. BRH_c41]